ILYKYTYLIKGVCNGGTYGQVLKCLNLENKEKTALKVLRSQEGWAGKKEVANLRRLKKLDPNKNNLVRFIDHFNHKGHFCMTFELLDITLHDFLEKEGPLSLSEIRMLVALNALKDIGLAHADIKPNKTMLVNHRLNPLKVKLVDFGTTVAVSKVLPGTVVQAIGYRAPEVILGLQVDEAIDIWGLGCVLAYMYLGQDLLVCLVFCPCNFLFYFEVLVLLFSSLLYFLVVSHVDCLPCPNVDHLCLV
uniref:Protein kinase domain-containing protein n=1 Tax=Echeneis naucrates TaxID=173247 RepID=A0A665WTT6_ECHNA